MTSATTINATSSMSSTSLSQNMMSLTNSQVSSAMSAPNMNSNNLNTSRVPTDNSQAYQVLNKQRLQDLVNEVDPNVHPDEDVEELLLQLAEDFINDVVDTSCRFAIHRDSKLLEVKDVQLSLEKNWNMWIPGFGGEELRPYKKSATTDAHKQRMALLKRAKK